MTITPGDSQTVGAYQLEGGRSNIGGNSGGIEQGSTTHLLDAAGTGTSQAQGPGGKEPLMTVLVPLDEHAVVAAVDGVGDRGMQSDRWL
jgi:hypothetical protein